MLGLGAMVVPGKTVKRCKNLAFSCGLRG
jgi:hypothetical protein